MLRFEFTSMLGINAPADHRWWIGFQPAAGLWVGVGELEGRPRWQWSAGLGVIKITVRQY